MHCPAQIIVYVGAGLGSPLSRLCGNWQWLALALPAGVNQKQDQWHGLASGNTVLMPPGQTLLSLSFYSLRSPTLTHTGIPLTICPPPAALKPPSPRSVYVSDGGFWLMCHQRAYRWILVNTPHMRACWHKSTNKTMQKHAHTHTHTKSTHSQTLTFAFTSHSRSPKY